MVEQHNQDHAAGPRGRGTRLMSTRLHCPSPGAFFLQLFRCWSARTLGTGCSLNLDLKRCVLVVYFFKDTEPSPLQDSSSVRQQGSLPGPPPVVPHPESIDAQACVSGGLPWTVAVTVLGLCKKLGCLKSIFALSIAELRHPPSLEGAIAEIDGLMITRPTLWNVARTSPDISSTDQRAL
jgi:hypothetical protein